MLLHAFKLLISVTGCFAPWKGARRADNRPLFEEGEDYLEKVQQRIDNEIFHLQEYLKEYFKRKVIQLYEDMSQVLKLVDAKRF